MKQENLNILIVGSGGREHALAWKLGQSARVKQIFVAPGNAGTAVSHTNVAIKDSDIDGLLTFAQEHNIDLTVVGPEVPLSLGLVDRFQAAGLMVFGPSQAAAQLESSKAFAKTFMLKHNIPTAVSATFNEFELAKAFVLENSATINRDGIVIKASGLAAGKGVFVCDNMEDAIVALEQTMIDHAFGTAGDEVVIEERLVGSEVSLLAFSDGKTVVPMLPARDHKRVFDDDEGPNTGGMGVYAPPPDVDDAWIRQVQQTVLEPTVKGMAQRGTPYVGVLYAGLMLTSEGAKVLEFNCRFGDPETQVLLPMLDSDLVDVIETCLNGTLVPEDVQLHDGACAAVVMASEGYPGSYPKGLPITGLDFMPDDVLVFHAGTALLGDTVVTSGGRVLAVCARGADLETAVSRAYTGINHIHFEGAHFRNDIGR